MDAVTSVRNTQELRAGSGASQSNQPVYSRVPMNSDLALEDEQLPDIKFLPAANSRMSKHLRQGRKSTSLLLSSSAFFLDDELFESELDVDPLVLPAFDQAEKLLRSYMISCHSSFPLIAKKKFTQVFYHCTSIEA